MWKLFLHLVLKGKTRQGFPNSIKGVGEKSALPVGGEGMGMEYQVKMKMVQGHRLQLKMKFLLSYKMKIGY